MSTTYMLIRMTDSTLRQHFNPYAPDINLYEHKHSHNTSNIAHQMRRSCVFLRARFLQKFNRRITGHLQYWTSSSPITSHTCVLPQQTKKTPLLNDNSHNVPIALFSKNDREMNLSTNLRWIFDVDNDHVDANKQNETPPYDQDQRQNRLLFAQVPLFNFEITHIYRPRNTNNLPPHRLDLSSDVPIIRLATQTVPAELRPQKNMSPVRITPRSNDTVIQNICCRFLITN